MRKPVIAGNWKMNTTLSSGKTLLQNIKEALPDINCDVITCPPFTHLETAQSILKGTPIHLGAQNMSTEESGAFTGEISANMIKELHCSYIIIGHSERRSIFKETHDDVNKKLKVALSHDINPILCVGEHLSDRENNKTLEVIQVQLKEGLKNISPSDLDDKDLIIAYEPIWAIGTGKVATPEQAQDVHAFIRKTLTDLLGSSLAEKTRLQYGGSVNPSNAAELLSQPDIDGALVGGACLDATSFLEIISATA